MKSTAIACLALMSIAGVAQAQTILFNSNGFESPTYAVGQLAGQNGWLSDVAAATSVGTIQTTTVAAGSQAVRVGGGVATNWFYPDISYTPAAGEIISVKADIARTLSSAGAASSFGFLLDVYSTAGARIARAGLGSSAGAIRAVVTSLNSAGTPATTLANTTLYNSLQFVNFEILLNFTARTFELKVDGTSVGAAFPFLSNTATALGDGDLQVSTVAGANDAGFFDNYVVSVIPTPGAAAVLGMGGLVALRRRRK